MRRSSARPLATVALLFIALYAHGQAERRVGIVPERPEAGSAFVITVTLPGESAQELEALEPRVLGPARYTGASLKPASLSESAVASVIEYSFMTIEPGRIDILGLSALSMGRLLQFGTWSIEAIPGSVPAPKRFAYWKAPGSVTEGQRFIVSTRDSDGHPVACPNFSVSGALFEPVPGAPGAFYAVALKSGSILLPGIEGIGDNCDLLAYSIDVKPVPVIASGIHAVGTDFSLALTIAEYTQDVTIGEPISWDLCATGLAWPGLSMPPVLELEGPGRGETTILDGFAYSGQHDVGSYSLSGLRGTLILKAPGVYVLRPAAYSWLNTQDGVVRKALAQAVKLNVIEPDKVAWEPPEGLREFTAASLSSLAASQGHWAPVLYAFEKDDVSGACELAHSLLAIGSKKGSIINAGRVVRGARLEIMAIASLCLLDRDSDDAERAESYAVLLQKEAGAFPPRNLSAILDALSRSFGNLYRYRFVIPSPGYTGMAALVCLAILLVIVALYLRRQRETRKARLKGLLILMAIVFAIMISLVLASAHERTRPRFVSLGTKTRTVPSLLSAEGNDVPAGRSGRVLESAGSWVFVELDTGDAAWLSSDEVVLY